MYKGALSNECLCTTSKNPFSVLFVVLLVLQSPCFAADGHSRRWPARHDILFVLCVLPFVVDLRDGNLIIAHECRPPDENCDDGRGCGGMENEKTSSCIGKKNIHNRNQKLYCTYIYAAVMVERKSKTETEIGARAKEVGTAAYVLLRCRRKML